MKPTMPSRTAVMMRVIAGIVACSYLSTLDEIQKPIAIAGSTGRAIEKSLRKTARVLGTISSPGIMSTRSTSKRNSSAKVAMTTTMTCSQSSFIFAIISDAPLLFAPLSGKFSAAAHCRQP